MRGHLSKLLQNNVSKMRLKLSKNGYNVTYV